MKKQIQKEQIQKKQIQKEYRPEELRPEELRPDELRPDELSPEEAKQYLSERERYLLHIKKEKEKALRNVPDGTLRVCSTGDRTQFYHRINAKDATGIYIRDKDVALACQLAQKDYDKKILSAVKKELEAIHKYAEKMPDLEAEQIYDSLHRARRKLVKPIRKTDEQFIRAWESVIYRGKKFRNDLPELYTAKGERVRSKSEIIIADSLAREGIPYRYEFPVRLKQIGNVYPDFTVLNVKRRKEMYWEHLGMMDDSEYVEKAVQKIASYEKNGIYTGDCLILTYETQMHPINQKQINGIIHHYLL